MACHQDFHFSDLAVARFGAGDVRLLLAELGDEQSHDDVSINSAMAIAIDLAVLGERRGATILDVGRCVDTIGLLLSSIGYNVTVIDSARDTLDDDRVEFVRADLRGFLASYDPTFDVVLLLSVDHHWLEGHGSTGITQFDRDSARNTLVELCSRVRDYIYLEIPLEDENIERSPDPERGVLFPGWFLDTGLAIDSSLIASTIATDGEPRRIYRIRMA